MNVENLPVARQPFEPLREPVPRSKEAAAAQFWCESMRCSLSGMACARICQKSQVAPFRAAGAMHCAACPAGRARMRLLGLGGSVEADAVRAVRVRDGHHAPSDSVCLRCKARPASQMNYSYIGFCKPCVRMARAVAAKQCPTAKGRMKVAVAWLKAGSVV